MQDSLTKPGDARESFISRGKKILLGSYFIASTAMGGMLIVDDIGWYLKLGLGVLLLVSFLLFARHFMRWAAKLDELQQLIAWRAMGVAGLLTVWWILFVSFVFEITGFGGLWLTVALGPPQFWLFAIAMMIVAEKRYLAG